MSSGRLFKMHLTKWAHDFGVSMDALARQTVQELSENVVRDTPVDTGFLRSSWQPSLGEPAKSEGAPMSGPAAASKVMSEVGIIAAGMKAGDIFYMVNNAEYAPHVEFGTSKMQGRFFVTDNMKRAQSIVAKIVKELSAA